ncbi:histidine ammonia-lyase [Shouchella lehensis]|uniref:Histidine ammonia-lyase n=1 Tax=Shouchella lehensis G1 TaxID=1246626 RepID=A0A060M6Z8_9BACI|nr:histidine ammonia-lyase [Shouchella lehensis]AIC96338.1 Histidine ammonia-lyase [Shouchella lehensis G1]
MVYLTGKTLEMEDVKKILWQSEQVAIDSACISSIHHSRSAVEEIVEEQRTVYGINTGFGKFSDVRIEKEDVEELQRNLLVSHACGVGPLFEKDVTKTMMLLRANALVKGYSGIRIEVIQRLLDFVNMDVYPCVPQKGSLGASGDLAPLSHLALPLIGEGDVWYRGVKRSALEALQMLGMAPIRLQAKEGLALINGTQAMTATGVIAYLEAEKLAYDAEKIASITLEGLEGIIDAFDESIHRARGYPEQTACAARIRSYLKDSRLVTTQGEKRVQDAYSLRCIPQVHGATWQTLGYVKEKLIIEMNAATDNPLIVEGGKKVISGGNFHGQPIALAMDFMAIAMAELGNISERRIERLVNPQLNTLPPFLSPAPGLQSGAMIMQYVAAALVSENKTLAHPASVDSIPSSANQEDHVSMGTIGARHALEVVANVRHVYAIEAICAMEATSYRGTENMATATCRWHVQMRKIVSTITEDRMFAKDIEALAAWLKEEKNA